MAKALILLLSTLSRQIKIRRFSSGSSLINPFWSFKVYSKKLELGAYAVSKRYYLASSTSG